MYTWGDLVYGGQLDVLGEAPAARLAGDISNKKVFVTETSLLGASQAPTWSQVFLSDLASANGTSSALNNGNYPQVWDWSLTGGSAQTAMTFGEAAPAPTMGDVEVAISTTSGSRAVPLNIIQGSGPTTSAAVTPNVLTVMGGSGGIPTSGNGNTGGGFSLTAGNGSTGSSTGNGGTGGAFTDMAGTGGSGGGPSTAGGTGGSDTVAAGAGGIPGSGGAGGNGGGMTLSTGAGHNGGSSSGTGGTGGTLSLSASAGGAATSGSGGAGGAVSIMAGTGGNATGTNINGSGGNVTLTAGVKGTGGSSSSGSSGSVILNAGGANIAAATPASTLNVVSAGQFGFTSSTDPTVPPDTGLSRDSAGVIDFGTGTQGNTAGTLRTSRLYAGSLAPMCTFSTGGGSSPMCALDTGSTDSAGIIIATTGSGSPATNGTIQLTFSSATAFGTHKPVCIFMASDAGTSWANQVIMRDLTPSTTSDTLKWINGSTALSTGSPYWINYQCWAK